MEMAKTARKALHDFRKKQEQQEKEFQRRREERSRSLDDLLKRERERRETREGELQQKVKNIREDQAKKLETYRALLSSKRQGGDDGPSRDATGEIASSLKARAAQRRKQHLGPAKINEENAGKA